MPSSRRRRTPVPAMPSPSRDARRSSSSRSRAGRRPAAEPEPFVPPTVDDADRRRPHRAEPAAATPDERRPSTSEPDVARRRARRRSPACDGRRADDGPQHRGRRRARERDADDDAYLAELRKAMTDESPLGPRGRRRRRRRASRSAVRTSLGDVAVPARAVAADARHIRAAIWSGCLGCPRS